MTDELWIVIADAARGRVFARSGRTGPWRLVQALVHPRSVAKVHDIMAGKAGRVQQSLGGSRSAADPRTDPKDVEAKRFAGEIGAVLAAGRDEHAFARLVLVAPPRFLGLLRRSLTDRVRTCIAATIAKDLSEAPDHELPARLADELP